MSSLGPIIGLAQLPEQTVHMVFILLLSLPLQTPRQRDILGDLSLLDDLLRVEEFEVVLFEDSFLGDDGSADARSRSSA